MTIHVETKKCGFAVVLDHVCQVSEFGDANNTLGPWKGGESSLGEAIWKDDSDHGGFADFLKRTVLLIRQVAGQLLRGMG